MRFQLRMSALFGFVLVIATGASELRSQRHSLPAEGAQQDPTPGFAIQTATPTPPSFFVATPTPFPTRTPTPPPTRTPTPRISPTPSPTPRLSPTPTPAAQFSTAIVPTETPPPLATAPPGQDFAVPSPTATPFGLTAGSPTPTPPTILDPGLPPGVFPDLFVTGMEVTQGIQNLQNQMPLVAHRATAVRVYVRTQGPAIPMGDVRGALGGWRDGQFLGIVWPENGPIIARGDGGERINRDDSLYFYLPNHWRSAGELTLKAFVYRANPNTPANFEVDAENNYWETMVQFWPAQPLKLRLLPIHLHDMEIIGDDDANIFEEEVTYLFQDNQQAVMQMILHNLRLLPIAALQWNARLLFTPQIPATVYPPDHYIGAEWMLILGSHRTEVHTQMAIFKNWNAYTEAWHWYGMIDPSVHLGFTASGGTAGGWASSSTGTAFGKMGPDVGSAPWHLNYGSTLAHEIGHNRGRPHVPCTGTESSPDADYPWPLIEDETTTIQECSLAEVNPEGYYGFDVYWALWSNLVSGPTAISNDPAAPEPHRGFPFMGYKRPRWSDPYTFCKLLPTFGVPCSVEELNIRYPGIQPELLASAGSAAGGHSHGSEASGATTPTAAVRNVDGYVMVSVVVDVDRSAAEFIAVLPMDAAAAAIDQSLARRAEMEALGGDLELRFEDVSGAVLATHVLANLDPEEHDVEGDDALGTEFEVLFFAELFEYPDATRRVVLLSGGVRLAEHVASDSAPVVEFVAPSGGGPLSVPFDIEWTATDADGDHLNYTLLYSPNDGEAWKVVAIGLHETSLRIESLDILPGSDQGRFRIVASDGFNVGEAVSDGGFIIPNAPPTAAIMSPVDGASFEQGTTVVLHAAASDLEDGMVAGDGFSWRSSLDGNLGTGEELHVRSLQPGRHVITVLATDSGGATAEGSVEIVIIASDSSLVPSSEEQREVRRLLTGETDGDNMLLIIGGIAGVAVLLALVVGGLILLRRRAAAVVG